MKILKFGAIWCSGCLVMSPRMKQIEAERPWLETVYYDYDIDVTEVRRWDVSSILPTFIFIDKEGKEITRLSGEKDRALLIKLIEEHKEK